MALALTDEHAQLAASVRAWAERNSPPESVRAAASGNDGGAAEYRDTLSPSLAEQGLLGLHVGGRQALRETEQGRIDGVHCRRRIAAIESRRERSGPVDECGRRGRLKFPWRRRHAARESSRLR